jgi:hypothetical protein
MQSIVALFWRIATFRSGPEDVPFSTFLAGAIVLLYIASATGLQLLLDETTLATALTSAIVNIAATAVLLWTLMRTMSKKARFTQTLTAIVGSDLLITLVQAIALPIAMNLHATLFTLLATATVFWTLAVFGFIFHRALDVHVAIGIAIALFLLLLSVSITQTALSNL